MGPRLRDIPFIPVLLALHGLFILASLVLRIYQLINAPPSEEASMTRSSRSPPRHVGIAFSARIPRNARTSTFKLRKAYLESIKNIVRFAQTCGVQEVSVHDSQGVLESIKPLILSELLSLPPSPPASSPSSPSLRPSRSPQRQDHDHPPRWEVTTLSIFPQRASSPPRRHSSRSSSYESDPATISSITLHLIPPSQDLMTDITREIIAEGIPTPKITQELLNRRIEDALHASPPDLLIIHPLTPLPLWKALLPRAAPELAGFPFWSLRITEIYQHPSPLPLSMLEPLLSLARRSSLPFLRKLGNLLPPDEVDERNCVPGTLRRAEWEGAMRAWSQVEQRLGK